MGQRMLGVACVCALAMLVAAPVAVADHNTVTKADKSDRSLVKLYRDCGSARPLSLPLAVNDPALGAGMNACVPVQNGGAVATFGPKSIATLKQTRLAPGKKIKDRAKENRIPGSGDAHPKNREANEDGDVLVSLTATDMRGAGDLPLEGLNEALEYRFRLTDKNCSGDVSCTTSEVLTPIRRWSGATPATFCAAGKCQFTTTLDTSAADLDSDPVYGFYFNGTATNDFIVPGKAMNMEETTVCTTQTGLCQGLLVGKSNGPDPAGFTRPMKANKIQLALVRDFAKTSPCVGTSVSHNSPWAFSGCTPPVEPSALVDFGSKGSGQIKLGPGKSATNQEVKVTATIKDVRQGADNNLKFDGDISVRFAVRVTHGECTGGVACTRPLQTATVDGSCKKGTCKVVGVTDLKLPQSGVSSVEIGALNAGPDPYTSVTDQAICVYDKPASEPGGQPFACTGTFVP